MENLPRNPSEREKGQITRALVRSFFPWLLQVILEHYIKPCDIDNSARNSLSFRYNTLNKEQKKALMLAGATGSYKHLQDVSFLYRLIRYSI